MTDALRLYIVRAKSGLTINHHSGGVALIMASSAEEAVDRVDLLRTTGPTERFYTIDDFDPFVATAEPWDGNMAVFPDAGCC